MSAQIDSLKILLQKKYKTADIINFISKQNLGGKAKTEFYNQAETVIKAKNDKLLLGKFFLKKARYLMELGNDNLSMLYYNKVIELTKNRKPSPMLAKAYQGIAFIWKRKGDLEQNIIFLNKALSIAKQLKGQHKIQFTVPLNKAKTLLKLGKEKEYLKMFKKSIQKLAKTNFYEIEILAIQNLATYYANKSNATGTTAYLDTAFIYFEQGLKKAEKLGVTRHIANLKMNFATVLALGKAKDSPKIDKYLKEAQKAFKKLQDPYQQAIVVHQMGIVAHARDDYLQSIIYFEQLLKISQNRDFAELLRAALGQLSYSYKMTKDYEKALYFMEKFNHLEDSLNSIKVKNKIIEIEKNYQIQQKESEVKVLKKEQELSQVRYTNLMIFLILISIFLIILFLVFWWRNKIKKALEAEKVLRLESEIESKRLQEENLKTTLEAQRLQEENLKTSLEQKSNQLLSKSIHLTERKEFINELISLLDNSKLNDDEKLKKLRKSLNQDQNQSSILKEFQTFFETHHHDFLEILKQSNPQLTQNELRLASFIKVGLTNKEIANILHVEHNTIKVARYRLKKKLFPENKEDSLEKLIKNL